MFEKCDLLQRAKEEYQNAIIFFQSGKRNDFYRYLGTGEGIERILRESFELTEEEDHQLTALTDICDEYDDRGTKFEWIEKAVKHIKDGNADGVDSREYNTMVYRCGKIIRVDIK